MCPVQPGFFPSTIWLNPPHNLPSSTFLFADPLAQAHSPLNPWKNVIHFISIGINPIDAQKSQLLVKE
jgi:hypothetical protein